MSTFLLQSQIRQRETKSRGTLITDGGLSVKCLRWTEKGRGRERGMRRLIFGCDLKQLFLCGALKKLLAHFLSSPFTVFRRTGTDYFPAERTKIALA